MIIPLTNDVQVPLETLAAFLNSHATNEAFRAISGSVAVSAYELESMPLPEPRQLAALTNLIRDGNATDEIEKICLQFYSI